MMTTIHDVHAAVESALARREHSEVISTGELIQEIRSAIETDVTDETIVGFIVKTAAIHQMNLVLDHKSGAG